jgi:hypothetical protein
MTLLGADAYFNRKVKVRNNICGSHFGMCCLGGGWVGTRDFVKSFDTF